MTKETMQELYYLSKNLKELRRQFGYTQTYVAQQLGIKCPSYHAYESGSAAPTLKHFIMLAKLYDVTLEDLIAP